VTDGNVSEEFFGIGIVDQVCFAVVASTLDEHAEDQTAVFRGFGDLLGSQLVFEVLVEVDFVHGNVVLAGKVLHNRGEECLREEKARNPLDDRLGVVHPVCEKVDTFYQVLHPGGQWLERQERHFSPVGGYLVRHESDAHILENICHGDSACQGTQEHRQTSAHRIGHLVLLLALLR